MRWSRPPSPGVLAATTTRARMIPTTPASRAAAPMRCSTSASNVAGGAAGAGRMARCGARALTQDGTDADDSSGPPQRSGVHGRPHRPRAASLRGRLWPRLDHGRRPDLGGGGAASGVQRRHHVSFDAPDGACLDQKALVRDPTVAQQIEIRRRDNGCRFPGCGCRTVTDIHHVVWASKQGPTIMSNLLTLCVAHHSRVHELGWKLDGDAQGEVQVHQPAGTRLRVLALTGVAATAKMMSV